MAKEPKTLQEAAVYFSDPANCRDYVVANRWPYGVKCPICGSDRVGFSEKHNRWQCGSHHPKRQFTCKTGTIFADSPLGLDKWLIAMWLTVNCKNGVSGWELHRSLGVTQKSAWFMSHRIREAMQISASGKMGGSGEPVEADETFVGGKIRNMHRSKVRAKYRGVPVQGATAKAIVMGIRDRETRQVRAKVISNVKRENLQTEILAIVGKRVTYSELTGKVVGEEF